MELKIATTPITVLIEDIVFFPLSYFHSRDIRSFVCSLARIRYINPQIEQETNQRLLK
jgi:hypothetical protein